MNTDYESIATRFMLQAIQDWGQTEGERRQAVQDLLDAAGFDAKATKGPVFGGIWPKPCTGKDGQAATAWLQRLTDNLQRGEMRSEVRQVQAELESQAALKAA